MSHSIDYACYYCPHCGNWSPVEDWSEASDEEKIAAFESGDAGPGDVVMICPVCSGDVVQ